MSTAKIDAVPAPNECPTSTKVNVCVLRSGFLLRAFSTRFSSRNLLRMYIAACTIPLCPSQSSRGGSNGNTSLSAFKSVNMSFMLSVPRFLISESKMLPRIDITQIPISILIETERRQQQMTLSLYKQLSSTYDTISPDNRFDDKIAILRLEGLYHSLKCSTKPLQSLNY
uniref:Uncharacterized protein n=1 Tax=Glossina pallidipes TaxID=7398 RepID=A0A1A9ZQE7_GLOPL